MEEFVLAMDYDGALFEGAWPDVKDPKKDVIKKVKEFQKAGAKIVLWTCREGKSLKEALARTNKEGLVFDAVNENTKYRKKRIKDTNDAYGLRKIYADMYIDDKSPNSIQYFLKLNAKDYIEKETEKKRKEKNESKGK